MISQSYTIGMMIKVIFVFCLLYIMIPSRIAQFDEEADKFLDKVFISLIHSTVITIIIVHVLAFLRLYDTFSLLFCYLLVYVFIIRFRGKSWYIVLEAMGLSLLVYLFNLSEGDTGFVGETRRIFKNWLNKISEKSKIQFKVFLGDPFYGVFPITVLLGAAFIRFRHAIFNATYSTSDTYLHLAWSKYIGLNQIYHDGVYPYGLHASISALHKVFFVDPYWLCRFIGPFVGVLIVLSVYYFTLRITRNFAASLFAAVVYGLITNSEFPSYIYRQTALISEEYAALFVLPGLYLLWIYLKSCKTKYLWLFAEALAVTLFIHPYPAFFLGLWSAVMVFIAIIFMKIRLKQIMQYISFSFIAGIIALFPLGLGLLTDKEFHKPSVNFVARNFDIKISGVNFFNTIQHTVFQNTFLKYAILIVLVLICAAFLRKMKDISLPTLSIVFITIITLLQYKASELELPVITEYYRTGAFLALILAVVYAFGFNIIWRVIPPARSSLVENIKSILYKTVIVIVSITILWFYPPDKQLKVINMEYNAAALNYLVIKRDFATPDWTIVAPTEQLEQVLGMGLHFELLRFVQSFTPQQVENPSFEFPIPTHHIFVFTEKIPLHYELEITGEYADKELEPEGNDPFTQYYHNAEQRAILEAKVIRLVETYKRSHENVSVFYEDDKMRIYHIYHEPNLESMSTSL